MPEWSACEIFTERPFPLNSRYGETVEKTMSKKEEKLPRTMTKSTSVASGFAKLTAPKCTQNKHCTDKSCLLGC